METSKEQGTNFCKKHRWSYEEDKTCCRIFIETYIMKHTNCSIDEVIKKILNVHPSMQIGSIRMKLQNIKQICLEYGIEDSSSISPLYKYSNQNLQAMRESLQQVNIII